MLARHGYGVLSLDSRGTGDSGGVGNAWGWDGTDFIAGAVSWLGAQPSVDPARIAILGLSMGGEEALTGAATDARIEAMVAEGASARVAEDLGYLPRGRQRRHPAYRCLAHVRGRGTDDPVAPPSPPRRLGGSSGGRVPVLLVVGNDPAEAPAARAFAAAAPALEVWQPQDTPHIQSLATHPREWEARVIGFLARAIRRDRSPNGHGPSSGTNS